MKKIVTIGELGIIITGNTPPRSNPKLYGNYTPFIKATDISETEKYTYHPEEYYSEEGYNKYIKSLIPKGSTCVVTIGSIGKKMTMAHCDLFINQAMNAIIPNENFDNEYVYYAVKNILPNIKMLDSGTASGRENVSKSAFSKMQILIEDNIITQRRIATILSRYDSLIENYQKQIKLLEESAQRLYKEWFVDLRFPGHENTKIVDGVPEGWEKKCLGDIFTFVRGKSYTSKELSDSGTIMVNLKNIQPFGGYKRGAEKYFIGTFREEQLLQKGDLVMGVTDMTQERRLVGQVALIPDLDKIVTFSMDLIKIIPYSIPKIYLYCTIRYGRISDRISPLANGVNVLHLKPEAMMDIEMIVPNIEIINAFTIYINKLIEKSLFLQNQTILLAEARDRLLPKLMSGEIEV